MSSVATCGVDSKIDAPGAAHLVLPQGVDLLDPQHTVFLGMLEGWRRNQVSRNLKEPSILNRLHLVELLQSFTNDYPWRWTSADVDSYWSQLRGQTNEPVKPSAVLHYQYGLHSFMEFTAMASWNLLVTSRE